MTFFVNLFFPSSSLGNFNPTIFPNNYVFNDGPNESSSNNYVFNDGATPATSNNYVFNNLPTS